MSKIYRGEFLNMSKDNENKYENVHWADNSAQQVINTFPDEKIYTVASGISPSGIIHVGHFREIITTEFVRKALERKGKTTKFIYSWDSYDAFRKVPKNVSIPNFEQYLRLADSDVPDPWECHESFAEHFMQEAEESLKVFHFPIEFQRQHKLQTSGIYADGIKKYLQNLDKAKEIIDKFRETPHPKNWMPLTIYCEKCHKDTTKGFDYDNEYSISYKCDCGNENRINFKETPIVKLPWRLDWPMRWDYYGVTFEPGGKDHSTPGGSYDTGKDIVKVISNREAPVYTFYNFVGMKSQGGKISSSSGNGATIAEVLKIYTPQMVLYIFASTRPNAEFDISFDLDVIKAYEDFDKLERIYFGLENEKNDKKLATLKRIYELSTPNNIQIPKSIPFQPSFRHLSTIIQANDLNYNKTYESFKDEIKTDFDELRFKQRFDVVKNWLEIYAPDEMKFSFQKEIPENLKSNLSKNKKQALIEIKDALKEVEQGKQLVSNFKEIADKFSIEPKELFSLLYLIILGKEKGPRLATLMIDNKDKIIPLLEKL